MDNQERKEALRFSAAVYSQEFKRHWQAFSLFIALLVGHALITLVAPYLFSTLIDDLPADLLPWLIGFGLYAAATTAAQALHYTIYGMSLIHAERLELFASTTFFASVARKTPSFFVTYNPAEIQSALDEGKRAISASFYTIFAYLLPSLLRVIFSVVLIATAIDVWLVLIVGMYGIIYIAIVLVAMEKTNRVLNDAIEAGQENAAFVGNAISMIEPIRHAGSTQWMEKKFEDKANRIYENLRAFANRQMFFGSVTALALFVQLLLSYLILYPRYQAGLQSVGDIVLFNMVLLQLNSPFEDIGHAIAEFQRSFAKFSPILKIMREPVDAYMDAHGEHPQHDTITSIVVDDVTYLYDNGRGVRRAFFEARYGALTFIIGETGAGKSTLLRILLKDLVPQNGSISIGEMQLEDLNKSDWLAMIGVVPQEIQILNDSVKSNVVLGRDFDEIRLISACKKAAIYDRICEMPDGFETKLGERGLKLSGGERQRIAIARALYNDPKILLLDEASSALDEETEREIMDQLRSVGEQLIIIAITHRMSSIRSGDQVVELRK